MSYFNTKIVKQLLISFIFVVFANTANTYAQTVFDKESPLLSLTDNSLITPENAVSADINNDGKIDIVVSDQHYKEIVWLENLGNGEFANKKRLTTEGIIVYSLIAADFNNDGNIDIAYTSDDSGIVVWQANDGNGNFGSQQIIDTYVTTYGINRLFTADLNGDGDMDIVTTYPKLYYYENDGNGNFGTAQSLIENNYIYTLKLIIIDFDMDDDLDIVWGQFNSVQLLTNDGNGNFTLGDEYIEINWLIDIDVVDMDNDNDLDIVASVWYYGYVYWYENNNDDFSQQHLVGNVHRGDFIRVADFDTDGDMDILAHAEWGDKLHLFENNGANTFAKSTLLSMTHISTALVADFNNSSKLDVLTFTTMPANNANIHLSINNDNLDFSPVIHLNNHQNKVEHIFFDDVSNDEINDILIHSSQNKLFRCLNPSTNVSTNEHEILTFTSSENSDIFQIDINGDNNLDVVVQNYDEQLSWYRNIVNGYLAAELPLSDDIPRMEKPYFVDFDKDGDIDVLSPYKSDVNGNINDQIVLQRNNGDNTFALLEVIYDNPNSENSIITTGAADLDNDSDIDLLISTSQQSIILWNDGNENFNDSYFLPNMLSATTFFLKDIDNDGQIDIISGDAQIHVYVNEGNGNFDYVQTVETQGYEKLFLVDMDNDDDLDLISFYPHSSTSYLRFHENINNHFATKQDIIKNHNYSDIAISDIDNDGYLDICAAYNNQIVWYKNKKEQLFNKTIIKGFTYTDYNMNGVFEADIDEKKTYITHVNPEAVGGIDYINGEFIKYLIPNANYNISVDIPNTWRTSTPSAYDIYANAAGDTIEISFGLHPPLTLSLKAFLETTPNTTENIMATILRNNDLLPSTQPYTQAPYNYTEQNASMYLRTNIVDWILLEAREATNTDNIVERKVALLQEDGLILGLDYSEQIIFNELTPNENYHIVVRHRNHIDIMSAEALTFTDSTTYDFTTDVSQAYGTNQQKMLPSGHVVMYAGDFDGNGIINNEDFNVYQNFSSQLNNYFPADANLDGTVSVRDFNYFLSNLSVTGINEIKY